MLTKSFLVVALISLCLYLYGILITITENEENLCKMTYMYEYPQYVRISFDENIIYPKYNLYAYAEGHLIEDARLKNFNGAPVLFIPGNSGSFKQIRSLASVALRKGLDNGYVQHLDYFAVDLNDEYSGVFGGVLEEQTKFVEICVLQILNLYKHLENRPENIVIIGHSMGGKIAQAILISERIRDKINLIITLSSPMDSPVIANDHYLHGFYDKIENFWMKSRFVNKITNQINYCSSGDRGRNPVAELKVAENLIGYHTQKLNSKVLITIGGGSRDRMVHAGLTASKYSDIHAMTTSIPNVWVTTDHLCTVWCLQLVLVINRFLYSLLKPQTIRPNTREKIFKGQKWIDSKADILEQGYFYFKTNRMINSEKSPIEKYMVDPGSRANFGKWVETNKRIFTERFKEGINETYVQMIRLVDTPQHKILYGEIVNLETSDYIFGCAANDVTKNMRYCTKGLSITSQFSRKVPSLRHDRHLFKMNLHNIKKKYPLWTHIILRFLPTKEPFQLNVDIHNSGDREVILNVPKWYATAPEVLIDETIIGSSHYNLLVRGIEETHRTIELTIRPKSCSYNQFHVVAKLCIPWADGYNRYYYFTETKRKPMYIYTPQQRPPGYNVTQNPLRVELNLDPSCRYTITVKNSLGMTMARIVQQFSHWIPAHLVAILLLALKHQISLTPTNENFKCGKLHTSVLKSSSFFLITASRVFIKGVLLVKFLPIVDKYDLPLTVSIVIHGASLAIISLGTGLLWGAITFFGNIVHKIIYRMIKLPIPTISGILIPIIERFPITIAIILISISLASCGAVSLVLACIVYFVLLSKMYENYLEQFIFRTAEEIARKLFGKMEIANKINNDDETEDKGNDGDKKDENENPNAEEENNESNDAVKTISGCVEVDETEDGENKETVEHLDEPDEESIKLDQEMEKLLNESLEKEKQRYDLRRQDLQSQRSEFDAVIDGLSKINFHITLFFLLIILSILNVPSAITWAKNYTFSTALKPDPSIIPSLVTISSLSVLWQMDTPRNIHGYRIIASILYTCAAICILYCQDSVYRLNAVIPTIFLFVALHQICGRKFVKNQFLVSDEIHDRIEKLRELIQ